MSKNKVAVSATIKREVEEALNKRFQDITIKQANNGEKPPSFSEIIEKALESSVFLNEELYKELEEEYKEFNNNKLEKVSFRNFLEHKLEKTIKD